MNARRVLQASHNLDQRVVDAIAAKALNRYLNSKAFINFGVRIDAWLDDALQDPLFAPLSDYATKMAGEDDDKAYRVFEQVLKQVRMKMKELYRQR
jgi:hypothetical protein